MVPPELLYRSGDKRIFEQREIEEQKMRLVTVNDCDNELGI